MKCFVLKLNFIASMILLKIYSPFIFSENAIVFIIFDLQIDEAIGFSSRLIGNENFNMIDINVPISLQ